MEESGSSDFVLKEVRFISGGDYGLHLLASGEDILEE